MRCFCEITEKTGDLTILLVKFPVLSIFCPPKREILYRLGGVTPLIKVYFPIQGESFPLDNNYCAVWVEIPLPIERAAINQVFHTPCRLLR